VAGRTPARFIKDKQGNPIPHFKGGVFHLLMENRLETVRILKILKIPEIQPKILEIPKMRPKILEIPEIRPEIPAILKSDVQVPKE